jgi:hypothetical protein
MAAKVTDVDKGYTARLRAIRSMDGKVTSKVGVFGEKASEAHDDKSGLSTGELAAIHEFGAGNVPERSFVRGWADEKVGEIQRQLKRAAAAVMVGNGDIYQNMHRFGQWADLEMVKRITGHIPPPLAPATVRRKGHAVPLIDTGKLLASIDSAVERNGAVVK